MSKKFELPPIVGMDPAYSPRTGRLRTPAEIEALKRGLPPPTTLGFSGKPGAVAAGISGRAERKVDTAYLRMLQEPGPTQRGQSPLRASGVLSATLARSFQNYINFYLRSKEKDEALKYKMDDYFRAMEEQQRQSQQRQHQQRQHQQQQHQQRARPRSRSPEPAQSDRYLHPQTKAEAFSILRIPPTSSESEIRKAYRILALRLHPDKNIDNLEEATAQFQQLQAAMDMIKKSGQMGGRNRSYRLYRKLKTCHRRRNSRHAKRSHRSSKSSKSSKRYSKTYRR
jgi:hypothetical protein